MKTIDFYFDFSSPYGYFAAEQIENLAAKHGATVNWHPILLGVIFKANGAAPAANPVKWDYAINDFNRSARFYGLPYRHPAPFPIATQHAARAFYWAATQDMERAKNLALALYRAYFVAGQDISSQETVLEIADASGWDRTALAAALASDEIKAALKTACETAIARRVYGSPFFLIGDEGFFGADRLPHVEAWLANFDRGGF